MKLPYSWLKELVDITVAPEQLAKDMASIGLEVESIETRRVPDGVIVAEVVSVEKHPDAERLTLCTVNTGSATEHIVCGAPNVKAGMRTALASPGCVLGPGMVVKKTKIRGVESSGMLCSERDLSLSDDHSGIMEIAVDDAPRGTPLRELFGDDAVLEVELTPNRGDCLSVLGVAREVAAKYGLPIASPALTPREAGDDIAGAISVHIENADACPRYLGRLVRGVTIGESPLWLKKKLRAGGLRPINNVVDITNYILLLFGQPMHAFDYARIGGRKIIVKNASDGEVFVTLDGVERKLCGEDLLIGDAGRAIALAGVMGGANSEISEATTEVFLECAFFNPVGIRKTAKRVEHATDSSYRFERGVDPGQGLVEAIDTAAELIRRLAGGSIVSGLVDAYPKKLEPRRITLRPHRVSQLLGIEIPVEKITGTLSALQIRAVGKGPDTLEFEVPLFRHDLILEADLIEEVGRLYGYDNIPSNETATVWMKRAINTRRKAVDTVRKALAFGGFNEVYANSMSSERKRALLTPDIPPVVLRNPLNPDMAQMRTTLLGNMLDITAYNMNRKNLNNRLFEIGKTYASRGPDTLPIERDTVGILVEGNYEPASWSQGARPADFGVLKAIVESLAAHCGARGIMVEALKQHAWFGNEAARVRWDGVTGVMGLVKKGVRTAFNIDSPVYYTELDISDFIAAKPHTPSYSPLPRHPAVERDFSFVMQETLASAVVSEEIRGVSQLVEWVEPFDVYHGEKLGPGLKSVAFAVRLRAPDRTLTDKEADTVCERLVETVARKHGAQLRS